jgi:hypothetical protein
MENKDAAVQEIPQPNSMVSAADADLMSVQWTIV